MERKFKVWDKVENKWIDDSDIAINQEGLLFIRYEGQCNFVPMSLTKSANYEIVFFTGLYDGTKWEDLPQYEQQIFRISLGTEYGSVAKKKWKGREIYEGDIGRLGTLDLKFMIVYFDGRFAIKDTRYLNDEFPMDNDLGLICYRKRIEIIGNKFKNGGLLK